MKTLTSFIFTTTFIFTALFTANANNGSAGNGSGYCVWDFCFQKPAPNQHFQEGDDVYVRIEPKKQYDIAYVELFINGKLIRKESSYPYEWAVGHGNSDPYLRKMKQGVYKLKARLRDKCGQYHEEYHTFEVKCHTGGGKYCVWESEFEYPKHNYTYKAGDDVYVKVNPKKQYDIDYIELFLNGKFIRKESNFPFEWAVGQGNSDPALRNMRPGNYKLKARIKDKCGDYHEIYCGFEVKGNYGGGACHCQWQSWFSFPDCKKVHPAGRDLYVRVETKNPKDIEYMELFVNGQSVRKQYKFPYEWCVGTGNSDSCLRRMRVGTYKLKVKIKDKCGDYHEEECTVYVKNEYR